MELTLREAAALLHRPVRTLRAQLARGEVSGVKRDGRWFIPRAALPETEGQRQAVQMRADAVRSAVEAALPSRTATRGHERRRSIADLDSFRAARAVWRQMVGAEGATPNEVAARDCLAQALLELAEGVHAFDCRSKLLVLRSARSRLSRAVGLLLLDCDDVPAEPRRSWLAAIETVALPALGGLLRWTERMREQSRGRAVKRAAPWSRRS